MISDVQNLIELQKVDKEILRLKEEVAALPKRVAVIEEKLVGTKKVLEDAKAAVKADETARRKYESTISDLQGKISKYRDQSLDVKTNEQYKALLHEIQFAEQEIRGNEDKILEMMVNAETREKKVKIAEAELKQEMADIEKEKAAAREQTAKDEKELAEWSTKRETLRAGVNADLLRQYERVSKFRGSGLSEVRDQQCLACRVMLRPQTYNDVRGGQIVHCESCQRILYFDPANEVVAEPSNAPHLRRRARPKLDAPQAWFYRPDYGEHGEVFLVFINARGDSSRRVYDAHGGRQVGDVLIREGEYRRAFPEDFNDHIIRLNGNWDEEEIDSWGAEMPTNTLDALRTDLESARGAAKSGNSHEAEAAVSTQTPAAS